MSTATAVKAASEKQVAFIISLASERDIEKLSGTAYERVFDVVTGSGKLLSSRDASMAIEALFDIPRNPKPGAVTETGMYLKDGRAFKVQLSGSGNLYAKELVEFVENRWHFEYASGAVKNLQASDKMTLEQAQEWGRRYGWCCQCGAELTDPKSIEAGIGPVCAKKF